jgi:DNA repair photolyase
MVCVTEVEAKSILNKSKIFDYCLNAYTGCQVNCRYCYARLFMRRYSGHTEPWGAFVDVKVNAPEVLRKQLIRAKRGTVWVSSVCDPYQPLEASFKLTRQCLAELAAKQFPVNIQTKSTLVLRDLDLIEKFETIEVGMTITTDDERLARVFEPGAPPVAARIEALGIVRSRGIRTFAFIGPLLPGNPQKLIAALEGKVDRILIDRMNYLPTIAGFYRRLRLDEALTERFFRDQAQSLALQADRCGLACEILF